LCVCVYIYIYTHTHTHTHTQARNLFLSLVPRTWLHRCTHAYIHACIYIHTCIHTLRRGNCLGPDARKLHAFIHTYIHTYTHACTHSQARELVLSVVPEIRTLYSAPCAASPIAISVPQSKTNPSSASGVSVCCVCLHICIHTHIHTGHTDTHISEQPHRDIYFLDENMST
jgi:hypothetical protein